MVEKQERKPEFRAILRIANKEVRGELPLYHAVSRVRGVGTTFANAIIRVLKLNRERKVGEVPAEEISKIEDVMRNPSKYKIAPWLFNRRKDISSGEDRHIVSSGLDLTKKFDIRRLRRIKCYIGMRHARGVKGLKVRVRGQRTKATGRKNKTVKARRR